MIDEIIKIYETEIKELEAKKKEVEKQAHAEMSQVLPYKWDWRGALLAVCACGMVVLCVVVLMFAIAGLP